jgi:hypothetical protein
MKVITNNKTEREIVQTIAFSLGYIWIGTRDRILRNLDDTQCNVYVFDEEQKKLGRCNYSYLDPLLTEIDGMTFEEFINKMEEELNNKQ